MSSQENEEIHLFFARAGAAFVFVNTSAFNMLGLDEWLGELKYVAAADSFDGWLPGAFVPPGPRFAQPDIEAQSRFLLAHPAVAAHLRRSAPGGTLLFLMFDQQAEALARGLGLRIGFPPAALRRRLDSKVVTTALASEAGIPSVPNVLGPVRGYRELRRLARALGEDLVVQLPYGHSGATTFFVSTEADYAPHAADIAAQPAVKVMRRIRCRQATIEGCVTRRGVLVGPLMAELIGLPELTPHRGGWCGNELAGADASGLLGPDVRRLAQQATAAMGERLRQEGYWGTYGLDFLLDEDSGALYLGELNPRLTGATPLTTRAALDAGEPPLFLFHLLEWLGADLPVDLARLNERWLTADPGAGWSQLIIDQTGERSGPIAGAPPSGLWRMDPTGAIHFVRPSFRGGDVAGGAEALFVRTVDEGQVPAPGQCLGRLLVRGRAAAPAGGLDDRARRWVAAFRARLGAYGPNQGWSADGNVRPPVPGAPVALCT